MINVYHHYNNTGKFQVTSVMFTDLSETTYKYAAETINQRVNWFIASADLSSKESYLHWVKAYKEIINHLQQTIKTFKKLRRPEVAKSSRQFDATFNKKFIRNAAENAHISDMSASKKIDTFIYRLLVILQMMQTAARKLLNARKNYKLASRMAKTLQNSN